MLVAAATVNAQTTWGIKAGFNSSTYKIGVEGVSLKADLGNNYGYYGGVVGCAPLSNSFGLQFELLYVLDGTRFAVQGSKIDKVMAMMEEPALGLDNLAASLNMHNVRLPLMLKYKTDAGLAVMAGPYVSYTAAVKLKGNSTIKKLYNDAMGEDAAELPFSKIESVLSDIVKDNINKLDVGASFGVEYQFTGGFFIDARYSFSFFNTLTKKYDLSSITSAFPAEPGDLDSFKGNWTDMIGVRPKLKYSAFQIGIGVRF